VKLRLLLFALVAVVLASTAGAATTVFTPKSIAGNWTGTWTNERFGSTGAASIVGKALKNNTQLLFTADFGGNVFGCADPAAETTKPITKGNGAGHWNAKGFVLQGNSKAFGALTLTYSAATQSLTGGGTNPPCANGLTWTVTGKFSGKSFTGKVNITLPDKSTAVSDLALTRS
jgi:hypothetical protein